MRREPSSQRLHAPGYCLATIEIVYRMPDHPDLLQTFIWQQWDMAPDFPALKRFLDYWEKHLDGPIHSVRLARSAPVDRTRLRHARHMQRLH